MGRSCSSICSISDKVSSAALVVVDLISSTRLALKLDSAYTEYSAQYLVDHVVASSHRLKLTVKNYIAFALNNGGIPKAEDWPQFGSVSKPLSSYKPALVLMKGQVIEPKNIEEVRDLLVHQLVGAKLHVFSPRNGPSGEPASYVGLRDGIIVKVEKIQRKTIGTVKIWYKKKFVFLKVAMARRFARFSQPQDIGPGTQPDFGPSLLLVDFCVPRLSME
ncbi:hypothetical protein AtNW77_Chr3g0195891 [Arabidopsis thaliana]